MTPVRIVPLLLIAVCLMGAAGRCTRAEVDHWEALLTGQSPAPQAAALYIEPVSVEAVVTEPSSSEEVVTVAVVPEVVPEPEVIVPPPCDDWTWRGRVYDCHGNWLYDL